MNRTVILAAGDFPAKGGEPRRILLSASRVVACDSAADAFRREFGRWPDVVVGDMDSIAVNPSTEVVRDADEETNDLAKALELCREREWEVFAVLGATGKREDHTVGNIYRALESQVRVVTETGDFFPVGGAAGTLKFKTWKNAGISIFAPDMRTKMSSRGLKWKLAGVEFRNAYCATLNRASSECVAIASDRPAFVYVERNPSARRVAVSLGSNIGNRAAHLKKALAALSRLPRTRLLDASSVVETKPVGVPREFSSMMFLNQAAVFETELEPLEFSRAMHAIEDRLGRVRTVKNGPRTIDIDLIEYEGVRMRNDELVLPHPRARRRRFVIEPLREIGVCIGFFKAGAITWKVLQLPCQKWSSLFVAAAMLIPIVGCFPLGPDFEDPEWDGPKAWSGDESIDIRLRDPPHLGRHTCQLRGLLPPPQA